MPISPFIRLRTCRPSNPDGLPLVAFGPRASIADTLILREIVPGWPTALATKVSNTDLADLASNTAPLAKLLQTIPQQWIIGTSSLRRRALLGAFNEKLKVEDCRGNVQRRLEKMEHGNYQGLILAEAGLQRLNLLHHSSLQLSPAQGWLPAPGQGVIALQANERNVTAMLAAQQLDDPAARQAVEIERRLAQMVGADCHAPFAALAHPVAGESVKGNCQLQAMMAKPDGQLRRGEAYGTWDQGSTLAEEVARQLT